MPGRGRKRRQQARRKANRRERRANRLGGSKMASGLSGAFGAATAVPRAGLDIVSDAALRTKQLLTPKG